MSTKITIIGAGSVGSTIAYTLAMDNDSASEIVLIDINKEKVDAINEFITKLFNGDYEGQY